MQIVIELVALALALIIVGVVLASATVAFVGFLS